MKKLIVKFPNDTEYEQLKIDAHQHNCNLSEYIRYLVAKERKEREKWNEKLRELEICQNVRPLAKKKWKNIEHNKMMR